MITGFFILVTFYLAYRLNRDEGIIVILQERIENIEKSILSEKFSSESESNY